MGGCVASKIDKDGRVQMCKERKKLMKQLVQLRGEFAEAQLAYLRALKNTGATLRQFTESESLELENASYGLRLPPSPPLPLPPSPPPPPPFSPESTKSIDHKKEDVHQEESIKIDDEDDCDTPPPPIIPSSSWNFWDDPFETSMPLHLEKSEIAEPAGEEENWAETKSEFEEEDHEGEGGVGNGIASSIPKPPQQQPPPPQQHMELADDKSSMMSWATKDTADRAMVLRRSRKTLEGLIRELDDYFLKASASGKGIAVLMDISKADSCLPQIFKENKRNRSSSAKVFSALSWSWSSKSLQFAKDDTEFFSLSERCNPGAHCITLDKLYAAEQKIYKEVKEEEMTRLELEKKSALLLKQEEENHDLNKTERTRQSVEGLGTDIRRLQHSISTTCSSALELIDVELHPQLVTLTTGLKNMWRVMYECHQVQNHISQQLNHLPDDQTIDLTTDYRRQATAQLETEVTSWYISFCKLVKTQQDYVRILFRWIQLTDGLVNDQQQRNCSFAVRRLCEEWQLVFDRLPDKVASEAIKSLLLAVQSIMVQQSEEYNLHKKSDKLEKRLQKELSSLAEMEKKLDWSFAAGDELSNLSPKHPLSLKRAKTEALRKRVDFEKNKYLTSVQVTKAITLNNLKTSLPNAFQALMGFSSAYTQAIAAVQSHNTDAVDCDASEDSMTQV